MTPLYAAEAFRSIANEFQGDRQMQELKVSTLLKRAMDGKRRWSVLALSVMPVSYTHL